MLSFLNNYFWGNFEDQVYLGTFSWWSKLWLHSSGDLFHNPFIGPEGFRYEIFNSNQLLIWIVVSLGYFIFSQNVFYNLFILFTFIFNYLCSFFTFKKFKLDTLIAIVLSTAFTFNPYVIIHSGRHLDLTIVGLIPIFIYLITNSILSSNNEITKKELIRVFLIITLQNLLSNYYAYFMLIILTLSYFLRLLYKEQISKKIVIIKQAICLYLAIILSFIIILFPYVQKVYFGKITNSSNIVIEYNRPLDDFIYFSSRPWYYLFPPENNLIYGNFTLETISKLKKINNYFLFDNYFLNEHGGNFIGFSNILTLILVILTFKSTDIIYKKRLLILVALTILITILSMPPFFTLAENTILTPSYILYKLFPMFRSINRLSIFVLMLILLINGNFLQQLRMWSSKRFNLYLIVYTALLLLDCVQPIKILDVSKTPEVYQYIKSNTSSNSQFAFYPSLKSVIYWSKEFERKIVNPYGYISKTINSPEFTSNLVTAEGIENLKKLNADYLVLFKDTNADSIKYFNSNKELLLVKEFDDSYLYKVVK